MNDKINILYVVPALLLGGTEKQLFLLLKGLDKSRFNPIVCCVVGEGAVAGMIRGLSVRVVNLGLKGVYDLRTIHLVMKLISEHKIDIVHSSLFGFDLFTDIAARLCSVRAVISSRREIAVWKRFHHKILQFMANIFVDRIVANSDAVRRFAIQQEKLSADKIITIYNGIDTSVFSGGLNRGGAKREMGIAEDKIVVGMISNFGAVKGHKYFLDAVKIVSSRYGNAFFVLMGDGPLKDETIGYCASLRMTEKVRFIDANCDIQKVLSVFDIFAFTSEQEGFPNVVLEAMAAGVPVVASNTGGVPEIITNGVNGILVEPKRPELFAKEIIRLMDDGNLRARIAEAARKTVGERFPLDRMVNAYSTLYAEMLSDR